MGIVDAASKMMASGCLWIVCVGSFRYTFNVIRRLCCISQGTEAGQKELIKFAPAFSHTHMHVCMSPLRRPSPLIRLFFMCMYLHTPVSLAAPVLMIFVSMSKLKRLKEKGDLVFEPFPSRSMASIWSEMQRHPGIRLRLQTLSLGLSDMRYRSDPLRTGHMPSAPTCMHTDMHAHLPAMFEEKHDKKPT